MSSGRTRTPVGFLIFNRPETTSRVFEEVRRAQPGRLLVVADGPRRDVPGEAELCQEARAITERVDWPCEVEREYAETNLGCKRRVSSGVSWIFERVAEAVLLEDDCLPHPSFFPYCEELLDRYRSEERVMHISGDNLRFGRGGEASYFFSRYAHVWGWASWRRAWRHYDPDLREWAADRERFLALFEDPGERRFWARAWDGSASGEIDTWDYQWAFACIANEGLAINPNVNLVSNIGFAADSTHTQEDAGGISALPTGEIERPLRHPPRIARDEACDAETGRRFFSEPEPQPKPPGDAGTGFLRRAARRLSFRR